MILQNKKTIGLFGGGSIIKEAIKYLCTKGVFIQYLVLDSKSVSFKRNEKFANARNIRIYSINQVRSMAESQKLEMVDVILSINNPYLLSKEILKTAKNNGYNLHPGKLPD